MKEESMPQPDSTTSDTKDTPELQGPFHTIFDVLHFRELLARAKARRLAKEAEAHK